MGNLYAGTRIGSQQKKIGHIEEMAVLYAASNYFRMLHRLHSLFSSLISGSQRRFLLCGLRSLFALLDR